MQVALGFFLFLIILLTESPHDRKQGPEIMGVEFWCTLQIYTIFRPLRLGVKFCFN
jgi:hypothetical protein